MQIPVRIEQSDLRELACDALVVNLFEGVTAPGGATGAVDAALGGRISRLIAAGDFSGRLGETLLLDPAASDAIAASRIVVVGLGPSADFDLQGVRQASAAALRAALARGAGQVATIVHGAGIGGLEPAGAAQATVEGGLLAGYRFEAYKSATGAGAGQSGAGAGAGKSAAEAGAGMSAAGAVTEAAGEGAGKSRKKTQLTGLSLVMRGDANLPAIRSGAAAGEAIAAGVALARDLANHPANVCTPRYLAAVAGDLAERHGMQLETWDRARIIAEGMGALASVAAGSEEEPRFIILRHAPADQASQAPMVLAGKAVTFDTGGISLKPGLKMGMMKMDMAGGAAVLGAMEAIGRLGLGRHVVALISATDNMPDGKATRPGDIVTALNGTTIEILNTDAEGRLVLADALSYAQRLKPAAVVDLATLTGAILIALGNGAAGLFPNDEALAEQLLAAGAASGERLWRLPMWDDPYAKMIESEVADIKNVLDSQPALAGSIFGAKFLERFVDYPWAHLDIAGMAWGDGKLPYESPGATGYGVRLLVEWLRRVV